MYDPETGLEELWEGERPDYDDDYDIQETIAEMRREVAESIRIERE